MTKNNQSGWDQDTTEIVTVVSNLLYHRAIFSISGTPLVQIETKKDTGGIKIDAW